MSAESELLVVAFTSAQAWERWIARAHGSPRGVWLRFFKKDSSVKSVSHAEALSIALCHGWIDGQLKKYDSESWLRKFTPRRPKSIWSKRNRELAEQLLAAGKMKSAGLQEISLAQADGRWDSAYDSPRAMTVPRDFLERLALDKKAAAFFKTLNKANTYAISWRLQIAKKPTTREKRMKTILAMLANGKVFHD